MMIRLTSPTGSGYTTHYVHHEGIARITEGGASSQWHGIRAYVRTFDGQVLECSETAEWIEEQIVKAQGAAT